MDYDDNDKILNLSNAYEVEDVEQNACQTIDRINSVTINSNNLFQAIPDYVMDNSKVGEFVKSFNTELASIELGDIELNEFSLSEYNEKTITIEWIYNYFRAVLSFEKDDEDMYGLIVSNTIDKVFESKFKPLKANYYSDAAFEIIQFVLKYI